MKENFDELRLQCNKRKQEEQEKFQDNSKRRLLNAIQKKFNTTIIGSLAVIEEFFGELWGHGRNYDDLSEDEQHWRKIWATARSRILDNGNSNLRAAQNEIAQYTLKWDRYVIQLPIKKEN